MTNANGRPDLSLPIVVVGGVAAIAAAFLTAPRGGDHERPQAGGLPAESSASAGPSVQPPALARVEVVAEADEPAPAESPEPDEWRPSPGSPLALPGALEAYAPSLERLKRELAQAKDSPLDLDAIELTDDVLHLWRISSEASALAVYALYYGEREQARWLAREPSVSLEEELRQVQPFIERHLLFDDETWDLVSAYSRDSQLLLIGSGHDASDFELDSAWDLFEALCRAGEPAWEALLEALYLQQGLTYPYQEED